MRPFQSDSSAGQSGQKPTDNKIECVDGWWRGVVDGVETDPDNIYKSYNFHAKDAWVSCSSGLSFGPIRKIILEIIFH